MENSMIVGRHGDCLIVKVSSLPSGLKTTGSNIIQSGEATGHHHRLVLKQQRTIKGSEPRCKVYENATGQRFFELEQPAELVHEEHKTLQLEEGKYAVVVEQEFDPFTNLIRRTVD